jgi:hypothetical protein
MDRGHPHHPNHHGVPAAGADVPDAPYLSIPDSELSPSNVFCRGFLRGAGLPGAGIAAVEAGAGIIAVAAGAFALPEAALAGDERVEHGVATGFEGAPSHHAPAGPGSGRGCYGNSPSPTLFAGHPPESCRTWGGLEAAEAANQR